MDNSTTINKKRKTQNAKHCEESLKKARKAAAEKRSAAKDEYADIDINDINMDFFMEAETADKEDNAKQTSSNNDDSDDSSPDALREIPDKEDRDLMTPDERLRGYYAMLNTQNVWGHDKNGIEALRASMAMLSTKTGMFARIPIYCKGEKCPYSESCGLVQWNIYPKGQACPVEIAMVQQSWEKYWDEFQLTENDYTDIKIVQEIIKMEVYMERCTGLMSKEGSPVQLTVAGVTENGEPIESPQVAKSVEAYERYSKIRERDYGLLLATRRDKLKKGEDKQEKNIFDVIAEAEQMGDLYEIDQRPSHIDGIDD